MMILVTLTVILEEVTGLLIHESVGLQILVVILHYLENPDYRGRIHTQLIKG